MSDLMERLMAANPVSEIDRPPIDDVWHKLDDLDRAGHGAGLKRARADTGRWALVLAAFAVPLIVVAAIAIPLLAGGHSNHGSSRGISPATRHHAPGPQPGGTSLALPEPSAQRLARRALAGGSGTVVALDPRNGRILAALGHTGTEYPPEATVDVLTAALALDRGAITPTQMLPAPARLPGTTVRNNEDTGLPPLTVSQALSRSTNTVFGWLGEELGVPTLIRYMERFGLRPGTPTDAAMMASGQGDVAASPLQMATVAAAVADDGILVAPRLTIGQPLVSHRVMSAPTASLISAALRNAVVDGTATSAAVRDLPVAGKTGTARLAHGTLDWFIGFAPAVHPVVAVAVLIIDPHGGYGGTVAAPVAARFLKALLQR